MQKGSDEKAEEERVRVENKRKSHGCIHTWRTKRGSNSCSQPSEGPYFQLKSWRNFQARLHLQSPSSSFQARRLLHRMSRATTRTGNRPRVGLSAQSIQINAHEMCDQRGSYVGINCHIAMSSRSRFGYFFVVVLNPTSKTFTCQFNATWSFKPGSRTKTMDSFPLEKESIRFGQRLKSRTCHFAEALAFGGVLKTG